MKQKHLYTRIPARNDTWLLPVLLLVFIGLLLGMVSILSIISVGYKYGN